MNTCPRCGYCKECGRGGYWSWPYPYGTPYWVSPTWGGGAAGVGNYTIYNSTNAAAAPSTFKVDIPNNAVANGSYWQISTASKS